MTTLVHDIRDRRQVMHNGEPLGLLACWL